MAKFTNRTTETVQVVVLGGITKEDFTWNDLIEEYEIAHEGMIYGLCQFFFDDLNLGRKYRVALLPWGRSCVILEVC